MTGSIRTASLEFTAEPDAVFAVLADPVNHPRFDSTATVKACLTPGRLSLGSAFALRLAGSDGDQISPYETHNVVDVMDEPWSIGWRTSIPGSDQPGVTWRYDLERVSEGETLVALTYDWTGASSVDSEPIGLPIFSEDDLAGSLRLLADLVN